MLRETAVLLAEFAIILRGTSRLLIESTKV
jgi:hypothetical protein